MLKKINSRYPICTFWNPTASKMNIACIIKFQATICRLLMGRLWMLYFKGITMSSYISIIFKVSSNSKTSWFFDNRKLNYYIYSSFFISYNLQSHTLPRELSESTKTVKTREKPNLFIKIQNLIKCSLILMLILM